MVDIIWHAGFKLRVAESLRSTVESRGRHLIALKCYLSRICVWPVVKAAWGFGSGILVRGPRQCIPCRASE